jgi:hypothetical protein
MGDPKPVVELATRSNLLGKNSDSQKLNFETVLPKYDLSAGRGDFAGASLSMARLYFDDLGEVHHALGAEEINDQMGLQGIYIGFLIQQVTENRQEKVQTSPLAGDGSHTTFFGSTPLQYGYSGVLINGSNTKWREVFTKLYNNFLRGSAAVSKGRPVKVVYDNKVVSGWIVSMSQNLAAANEMVIPFNFTVQVIDEVILTSDEEIRQAFAEYTQQGAKNANYGVESTNSVLPMDDYVRKAAIRLPPRAISGGGSGSRCKVNPPERDKHGSSQKTKAPHGPVHSESPTKSTCDMAEALLYHARQLKANNAKLTEARKLKDKSKVALYTRAKNNNKKSLKNLQGWSQVEDTAGLSEYKKVLTDTGVTAAGENLAGANLNKVANYKRSAPSASVKKKAEAKRKAKE